MLNEENRYHAIDYAGDTRRFVVAGTQPYIEIYDEERMTKVQQIGDRINPAHTNKIFTCRFNPNAPNMIYSGSWDRQVRFWDVRANRLMSSIGSKTSISGDGVDISNDNNYVVTGGGTLGEGVQLWDFRNLERPLKKFVWFVAPSGDIVNPVVNAVKFVPK
jgi:WD40 repeat protein